MADPGLLKETPDIAALLPRGGGNREQAAAADGTTGRLDAVTDFSLNHQLVQLGLKGLANRQAALCKGDGADLVAITVAKRLLLQGQ